MKIFKKKLKLLPNGYEEHDDQKTCSKNIKKAHSDFRDYLKAVQEESQKEIDSNGDWLKVKNSIEG